MKLKFSILLILLMTVGKMDAQSFKDKFFYGPGITGALTSMPGQEVNSLFDRYDQVFGYAAGLNYSLRYSIFELNDNNSFGIGIIPAIELGIYGFIERDDIGLGGINLPIELSFNTGAGSTYNSNKEFGIAIKGGIDMNFLPIFMSKEGSLRDFNQFYVDPYVSLSGRFFGKRGTALRDVFLRFSFLSQTEGVTDEDDLIIPFNIRVGMNSIIGY
ncbi:MAG: hypothetical protein P8M17_01455 [Saprospiraceae bacterium]|nr:hypothetical protein [Saprospiraceae bacterium]MDG2417628.1 hypothetical protein [Saprospiraceae bacterium]